MKLCVFGLVNKGNFSRNSQFIPKYDAHRVSGAQLFLILGIIEFVCLLEYYMIDMFDAIRYDDRYVLVVCIYVFWM